MKNKKILLTGGHLSPLLSVYEVLKEKAEVVIVGRRYSFENDTTESLEYSLFKNRHVPFYDIHAPRLQRKFTKNTIPSFFKSPQAVMAALRILKKEKPDSILILGGYIGIPVALAAFMLKIPIVIHEQTLSAGLSNKLISKIAKKICISFSESSPYFDKKKIVLTGNPVRGEVFDVLEKPIIKIDKPLLYITGGSTGAHAINAITSEMLEVLLQDFSIIHQTGDSQEFSDYDMLSKKKEGLIESLKKRYVVKKFILPDEIGWIYKNAEVVFSRAGINTVTELLALNKKALLIPLPHGQKNEQLKNAQMYEQSGLGTYILQSEMTPEKVHKALNDLREKSVKEQKKEKSSSAQLISDVVLSV